MTTIVRNYPRPTEAQVHALAKHAAATIHEAMGRRGAMDSAIKPIYPGMPFAGVALTCVCHANDNLSLHVALKIARKGDVIVCAAGDYTEQGLFGDVMSSCAKGAGVAALVTDGGVRDRATIREIGFPVYSRGVSIKGTVKETLGPVNVPVSVGGVVVHPGDIVVGDDDGVVVVPRLEADATLAACAKREDKEAKMRAELITGKSTWDMLKLADMLKAKGVIVNLD
jgi:4-hydroxy-4-methyl-2-oxoglutarate aldolase